MSPGLVILAGAGPGDPTLVTLATRDAVRNAEVVLHDHLVPPELLEEAPATAELIYVGKEAGREVMSQTEINALLVELGHRSRRVVRLKGGDPFIFGRGGEEAEALVAAGIPFRVIPGVTAASALSAAGIPLTDRRFASAVALVTGTPAPDGGAPDLDWPALARFPGTLVFYMSVRVLENLLAELLRHGRAADEPAAVVERAGAATQKCVAGTLGNLAEKARAADVKPPALLVIGQAVSCRERLAWFERLPLYGCRILVTRPDEPDDRLTPLLREAGARVEEVPVIELIARDLSEQERLRLTGCGDCDWLIFTSTRGVREFWKRLRENGRDARALGRARLAAIGPGTAGALEKLGLVADLVPQEHIAETLLADLRKVVLPGQKILLPRSAAARPLLAEGLRAAGAEVDEIALYEPVTMTGNAAALEAALRSRPDYVTFTSSSAVAAAAELLARPLAEIFFATRLASLGPVATAALQSHGVKPAVEATAHTMAGLAAAIVDDRRKATPEVDHAR